MNPQLIMYIEHTNPPPPHPQNHKAQPLFPPSINNKSPCQSPPPPQPTNQPNTSPTTRPGRQRQAAGHDVHICPPPLVHGITRVFCCPNRVLDEQRLVLTLPMGIKGCCFVFYVWSGGWLEGLGGVYCLGWDWGWGETFWWFETWGDGGIGGGV